MKTLITDGRKVFAKYSRKRFKFSFSSSYISVLLHWRSDETERVWSYNTTDDPETKVKVNTRNETDSGETQGDDPSQLTY